MKQIDTKQWKEFVITDFFAPQIVSNKLSKLDIDDDGLIPVQSSESINNGILGYTSKKADFICENNEFYLIFGDHTKSMNIADYSFCVMDNVKVLKTKIHNKNIALFIITVWKKAIPDLGYARHWGIAKGKKFKLPIDETGGPDFSYMESYMKNLEVAVSSSLTDLQSAKKSSVSGEIDISRWKLFQISDLFNVQKGKRLTKADMKDGKIRFIGASAINNGITAYISNDKHLHSQNTITLSYNGSIGEAFYQDEVFWASDDVNVLYPKFEMNREIAFFIIPLLKTAGKRYAFVDKWKKEDMEKSKIPLPADIDGNPDYKYMENYVATKLSITENALNKLMVCV